MMQWNSRVEKEEDCLWLLTPEEVSSLPDGTKLNSIMGETKIKGLQHIDLDIRFGHTAWGILDIYSEKNAPLLVWIKLSV